MEKIQGIKNNKLIHFLYCPATGLGLYGGYRGDRWLKNRIRIFKEYVLPSLLNQSNSNFILLISWRPEEKTNPIVREFADYLNKFRDLDFIFTYTGILFWDDKYPDDLAEERLRGSLESILPQLKDIVGDSEWVLWTIQPSDDCYLYNNVEKLQDSELKEKALGYRNGYIIDLSTKRIADYNPTTTPPFYTIFFKRDTFLDPEKHFNYIGKCKSHEYVGNFLPYDFFDNRGFVVGTHFENISTTFNIPFKGDELSREEAGNIMRMAGILDAPCLKLGKGWKRLFFKLPHRVRRKIRYWVGERFYAKLHDFLNS